MRAKYAAIEHCDTVESMKSMGLRRMENSGSINFDQHNELDFFTNILVLMRFKNL